MFLPSRTGISYGQQYNVCRYIGNEHKIAFLAFDSFNKDVDECDRFLPCDQLCTNSDGSFQCSCHTGYRMDNSSQTCEGNPILCSFPKVFKLLTLCNRH